MNTVFAGFTKHVVWLCLFAFIVGAIMQLLKLDRRIALAILDKIKASSVGRVIWGMFFVNVILAFLIPAANARAATLAAGGKRHHQSARRQSGRGGGKKSDCNTVSWSTEP